MSDSIKEKREEQSAGLRRGKRVEDASDLRDAEQAIEEAGDALRETYDTWHGNMMNGVNVENSDANNNDQKNMARVVNDKKSFADAVKEDLALEEQRRAALDEADEQDEFLAEESSRLKRSLGQAGGRPKKSRLGVLHLSCSCSSLVFVMMLGACC